MLRLNFRIRFIKLGLGLGVSVRVDGYGKD